MIIKPNEIKSGKYWLHLALIAVIVLGALQLFKFGNMLTIKNILISTGLIGIADIISHSLLNLN